MKAEIERREYKRQWYIKNRDKRLAYNKLYYLENKERMYEWQRKYVAQHREAISSYHREWRVANRERDNKRQKEYLAEQKRLNPQKVREQEHRKSAKYYYSHRDAILSKCREHRIQNKLLYRLKDQKQYDRHSAYYRAKAMQRRMLKLSLQSNHTWEQWIARVEFYGWKCVYCETPLTLKTLTQDHRIPLTKGGSDWPSNLVPACLSCNCAKGSKKPCEFIRSENAA